MMSVYTESHSTSRVFGYQMYDAGVWMENPQRLAMQI